jgi:RHS repeat-associated protein
MMMPGRNYSAVSGYRYGFNGKEKSPEITSDDYDFGARIYDGRIGRWLSVDKLETVYTSLTPYQFGANGPINIFDSDGNILKDKNGNIIATSNGNKPPGTDTRDLSSRITKSERESGVISKRLVMKTEEITIYTDKGTSVKAHRVIESYIETTREDAGIETVDKDYNLKAAKLDASSNCHGYTFAGGNIWITDEKEIDKIISDEYSRLKTKDGATAGLVKWVDKKDKTYLYAHSGTINSDGTWNADDDMYEVDTKINENKFLRTHIPSPDLYAAYWNFIKRKKATDTEVDVDKQENKNDQTSGNNGLRVVSQDTKNKILKLIKKK